MDTSKYREQREEHAVVFSCEPNTMLIPMSQIPLPATHEKSLGHTEKSHVFLEVLPSQQKLLALFVAVFLGSGPVVGILKPLLPVPYDTKLLLPCEATEAFLDPTYPSTYVSTCAQQPAPFKRLKTISGDLVTRQ